MTKSLPVLLFTLALSYAVRAQVIYIDSILYTGNKKTQNYIIRRELDFRAGDSILIADLSSRFEQNRSRILNTGLFKDVAINIKHWNTLTNHTAIEIQLQEAWYIYPFPIFELADRNFNVWWTEFDRSLKRVNYGLKFFHNNLTGQADRLRITLQGGYNTKLDVDYNWPYWGYNRSFRFTSNITYSLNKETYYTTAENKLLFYKAQEDNEYSLKRFSISTGLEHRTTLQLFQSIKIGYQSHIVHSTISNELNPDFFLKGKTHQEFITLDYNFKYDDRDLKYYPNKGRLLEIEIRKEGIGKESAINTLSTSASLQQFIPWNQKHNLGILLKAKTSIIRNQIPYYNSRALGFGDNYLKGYEYYVIDGMDYFYLKFRERFRFFDKNIRFMGNKKYGIKSKPLKLGISAHAGTGYVNNVFYAKKNDLSNKWLYSYGLSLEGVLSNTSFFQTDISVNHLKQIGIFLHFNDNF